MTRPYGRVLATTALLGVIGQVLLAVPASAAPVGDIDEGLWYATRTGLDQIHAQTTGEGVTIALIDGQINPDAPDLVGADVQVKEPAYCADEPGGEAVAATATTPHAEHATNMASLLVGTGAGIDGQRGVRGVAPGASLRVYAITDSTSERCADPADGTREDDAVLDAIADGADIIAVPGARAINDAAIAAALRAGVVIVAAGGNERLVTGYPAQSNGVVATGTVDEAVALDPDSPKGAVLGVVAPGSHIRAIKATWDGYGISTGSSNSSSYTAAALALALSAHPDASGNQVVQAMIHTTDGRTVAEPAHDEAWGYGTVNIRQLLSVDPTSYPDENPFLYDATDRLPTVEQVLQSGPPATEAPATAADAAPDVEGPTPPDEGSANSTGLVLGLVGGGAVVLLAAVVGTTIARRRRQSTDTHDAQEPTYARGNHG